jgi:hypothetical protein
VVLIPTAAYFYFSQYFPRPVVPKEIDLGFYYILKVSRLHPTSNYHLPIPHFKQEMLFKFLLNNNRTFNLEV